MIQFLFNTPVPLLASLDLVLDSLVACSNNLGLEVEVHKLAFLGSPLAVRVPVEDQLAGSSVAHLGSGVGQCTLGRPLNLVACRLGNKERLAAACVAVSIETLLDGVVEDLALSYCGGWKELVMRKLEQDKGKENSPWTSKVGDGVAASKAVDVRSFSIPVMAKPAVRTLCAFGRYILSYDSESLGF